MKLLINSLPETNNHQLVPAELNFIQQPNKERGLILSILVGLIIAFIPIVLLSVESAVFSRAGINNQETVPWWIFLPVLTVCILLHEFLHLIWHPGWGLSAKSSVNIWPRKLQIGVFYDGSMARSRWLAMRLSPLVGLTLLPTAFLLVAHFFSLNFLWQQFLVLIILVNSLGSGGDLLAAIIVYGQVPSRGEIGIWNGRSYWR